MIDERTEFAIAQYADGTLPHEQRAEVEALLSSDASARQLLQQYRRLDVSLQALPVAQLDFDALARRISGAVEQLDAAEQARRATGRAGVVGFIGRTRRLAIAAGVLVVVSVGSVLLMQSTNRPAVVSNPSSLAEQGLARLAVPLPTAPQGPALAIVRVGQPPLDAAYLEVVARPSRVVVAAAGPQEIGVDRLLR